MKIAMVLSTFPKLSETFILHQVTGLLDLGHDVRVISFGEPQEDVAHPDVEEYRLLDRTHYIDMPTTRLGLLRDLPSTFARLLTRHPRGLVSAVHVMQKRGGLARPYEIIQAERLIRVFGDCDMVHCHFGPNGLRALPAAIAAGLPTVTTFHGYDVGVYPNSAGKECYSQVFRLGRAFTANTSFSANRLLRLGCDEMRLVSLPMGVRLEELDFTERRPRNEGLVRLLTVARLECVKGHRYAIEAVARLIHQGYPLRYQIVGGGPEHEELVELISDLQVSNEIDLLGARARPDVLDLYGSCDIFILASVPTKDGAEEAQGLVLQEAQACGLPVVATDSGGIPEGVIPEESAFLVPERDVDTLARRLGYLIDNPQLWPGMGRAGRKLVEEKYDSRKLNERLVRIYENVLAGRPPGAGLF